MEKPEFRRMKGRRSTTSGLWRGGRLLWLVGMAAMVLSGPATVAAAEGEQVPEPGCPVVATAQGVQVMASKSDDLFLEAPAGAAVPAAQACVNHGLGDSRAFAGNPYPGATVLAVPGLLARSAGQPVPGYPAYVSSQYPPEDKSEVSEEGYSLQAQSGRTSSKGHARSGVRDEGTAVGALAASAEAEINPDDGSSWARASAQSDPVMINDVLALGQVRSVARAAVDSGGELSRQSQLRVGRTMVAGQEVEITPEGVRLAEEATGLGPMEVPEAGPAEALRDAGVGVRYLEEVETSHGVLSAGIEVTVRHQVDQGILTVEYTFGRAFAAAREVSGAGGGLDTDLGLQGPSGVDTSDPTLGEASASEGTSSSPAEPADRGSAPDVALDGGDSAESTDLPEPEVAVPETTDGDAQLTATQAVTPVDMGLAGVYLVIVAAGLTLAVSGTLLRLLGVKT